MRDVDDLPFEELLTYLKTHRGFDFTGYKRNSLKRRTQRRMDVLSINSFDDYRDYLEVHPDEFPFLFNTILINVTSFFRDENAWQYLAEEILPGMVESRAPDERIRVWSAGCASGQEAYSVAMLLWEAVASTAGEEQARSQVKIYATDVDEEALAEARRATYSLEQIQAVPASLRDKYFELISGRYGVRPDLRRAVIFGRHDLAQDAPISDLDLLICRNTLIYFNAETQRRILARFHFGLRDEGLLFLGQAEMLLSHAHLFTPVHAKHRLFSRRPQAQLGQRIDVLTTAINGERGEVWDQHARLRLAALDVVPVAQILINHQGRVIFVNGQAQTTLGLDRRDVGRPFQDLEISYRPLELRSLLEHAQQEEQAVLKVDVERTLPGDESQYLDIHVIPLYDDGRRLLGTSVIFENVTQRHEVQEQAAQAQEELETTYEELQSTNEELETTNEELQSAVEELQTTNEELQSTNDEMETMNEELHSSNEELRDVNLELRQRTLEAQRANEFLESILASLDIAVVVLNRELEVQLWNHRAQDMWGLRADEARGQAFLGLDIGLPVGALEELLSGLVRNEKGNHQITLKAHNRRGRAILCHVQATPLEAGQGVDGIVLLMEEAEA